MSPGCPNPSEGEPLLEDLRNICILAPSDGLAAATAPASLVPTEGAAVAGRFGERASPGPAAGGQGGWLVMGKGALPRRAGNASHCGSAGALRARPAARWRCQTWAGGAAGPVPLLPLTPQTCVAVPGWSVAFGVSSGVPNSALEIRNQSDYSSP